MNTLTFYAVYTNSRSEAAANARLRELGFETLFLHYKATIRHARKISTVIRSRFPRYLFVGVHPHQGLFNVKNAHGVSGIVCIGDAPVIVPNAVIEELRTRGDRNGFMKDAKDPDKDERPRLKAGQDVLIESGQWKEFAACVKEDMGDKVRVWVRGKTREYDAIFPSRCISPKD